MPLRMRHSMPTSLALGPVSHLWPPNQAAGWNVHEHVDANHRRDPARSQTMQPNEYADAWPGQP